LLRPCERPVLDPAKGSPTSETNEKFRTASGSFCGSERMSWPWRPCRRPLCCDRACMPRLPPDDLRRIRAWGVVLGRSPVPGALPCLPNLAGESSSCTPAGKVPVSIPQRDVLNALRSASRPMNHPALTLTGPWSGGNGLKLLAQEARGSALRRSGERCPRYRPRREFGSTPISRLIPMYMLIRSFGRAVFRPLARLILSAHMHVH